MRWAVFTGAGISAESGIPTFRGSSGLWKTFKSKELATPEAFKNDPKLVWEWYDWRRAIINRAEPNVDGLHQKAGSKKVVELHGNIWRVLRTVCGKM